MNTQNSPAPVHYRVMEFHLEGSRSILLEVCSNLEYARTVAMRKVNKYLLRGYEFLQISPLIWEWREIGGKEGMNAVTIAIEEITGGNAPLPYCKVMARHNNLTLLEHSPIDYYLLRYGDIMGRYSNVGCAIEAFDREVINRGSKQFIPFP